MKCSDCRFFDDSGCWYGDKCENQQLLERKSEKERKDKLLLEIKEIKEMDLSIPQHFTKEQSAWIKKYCIIKRKEAYNEALDDFMAKLDEDGILDYDENDGKYFKKIAEQLKEKKNEIKTDGRNTTNV